MDSHQKPQETIHYHKDGSVWAKGHLIGDTPTGYWEWFRKDGTLMRSGTFRNGIQVGKWTTYDKNGEVYKVTDMKEGKKGAARTVINQD
jgi:antitoxin component YwqK of YwqJK toxin-antitoxin module